MTVDWDQAKCKGMTDLFFVPPGDNRAVNEAKAICATCSLREPCLARCMMSGYTRRYGVFGGTTPKERQAMRHKFPPPIGWDEDPLTLEFWMQTSRLKS